LEPIEEFVLGGYRRQNVMQVGQNSEIWQVVDAATGRQMYAMKLLLPERTHDRKQRALLKYEAAVGKKLEHPKIIKTIKFGKDRDTVFILMEYFASINLKLRLMRKQIDTFMRPRMRSILGQTAQALGYMHSKGYVHRDVKPDNVLVDSIGNVRLIDFALAVKSAGMFAKKFGRRGSTMGTRSYMSPEQIRGLPVDTRADMYSFGVMIWELVHGRVPFVGRSSNELLRKHISDPAPLFEPQRKATKEFEALVLQMMAKKEKDRVQNMEDFQTRLRACKVFTDEPDEARAPEGRMPG